MWERVEALGKRILLGYCQILAQYYWLFVAGPTILAGVAAFGFLNVETKFRIDIHQLYTPLGAESYSELAIRRQFVRAGIVGGSLNSKSEVSISEMMTSNPKPPDPKAEEVITIFYHIPIVAASDSVNLVEPTVSARILRLLDFIAHRLNYTLNGVAYNFGATLCSNKCKNANNHLKTFLSYFHNASNLLPPGIDVHFTYPYMKLPILETMQPLDLFLHEVTTNEKAEIERIGGISSLYTVEIRNASMHHHLAAFESALQPYADSFASDPQIRIYYFSMQFMVLEILRAVLAAIPYIFGAACSLVLVATFLWYLGSVRKNLMAFFGLMSCFVSILFTFGVLLQANVKLNPTAAFAPYVLGSYGVYSNVLMLRSWKERTISRELRLVEMFNETICPLAIKTLIGTTTFACVIFISTSLAVVDFCKFVSLGVVLEFFFFSTAVPGLFVLADIIIGKFCPKASRISCGKGLDRFPDIPWLKFAAFGTYLCYFFVSLWGCSQIRLNFQTGDLFPDDSLLRGYFHFLDAQILSRRLETDVFIQKSPDFRDLDERQKFLNFLAKINSHPLSDGNLTPNFWFTEFQIYMEHIQTKPEDYYLKLNRFLKFNTQKSLDKDLHWNENRSQVTEFRFKKTFKFADSWEKRVELMDFLRDLARKHPEYQPAFYQVPLPHLNAFQCQVFQEIGFFLDCVKHLPETVLVVMGVAVLASSLLSLLFTWQPFSVFMQIFRFLSVHSGVFGFIGLTGISLDILSLNAFLASVGVSLVFHSATDRPDGSVGARCLMALGTASAIMAVSPSVNLRIFAIITIASDILNWLHLFLKFS